MKTRNGVVVFVVIVTAVVGITEISGRLHICTKGDSLDFPALCTGGV